VITGIPTALTAPETAQLQKLARGGTVLELGAHFGYSTIALAQVATRVHSVDWHQGDSMAGHMNSLEAYFTNLRRHGAPNVVTHVGRFEDVLPLFRDMAFDGVFIDGEHDRVSVARDTDLARRLVAPGGWLAWHDFGRFEVGAGIADGMGAWPIDLRQVDWLAWLQSI